MMNSRATILVLAPILAAALLFAAGDACEGVPSMTIEAACHAAAGTDSAMYDLCLQALHSSSLPDNKISTLAAAAAETAALVCDDTAGSIEVMLKDGLINRRHRIMWSGCVGDLRRAQRALATVEGQMRRCSFAHTRQEYVEASVAIRHCTDKLASVGPTPVRLQHSVVRSRESTVLASRLAASLMARPYACFEI